MSENEKQPAPRQGSKTPIFIIVASIAMALGVWVASQMSGGGPSAYVQIEAGTVLPQPKPLPRFNLVDHNQTAFDTTRFKGKWSFVFYGYTFCPDVCPTALATFKHVRDLIDAGQVGIDDVQFIFVSVDPDRDTPERLKEYVTYFSPDFIGVTGEVAQIDTLVRASGAVYAKVPGKDEKSYLVDHSAGVFLMGPKGDLQAFFGAPHDPERVAKGFEQLRSARS